MKAFEPMPTSPWPLLPLAAILMAGAALAQAPIVGAPAPAAATALGGAVFEARCKSCHEPSSEGAPEKAELAMRPKADIVTALTSGLMMQNAAGLTPAEIDAVATYLTTPAKPG